MSAFHFLRPAWLSALVPAVLLWWWLRRKTDTTRRWRTAIDPALLRHFVVGGRTNGWLRPADTLLAAWVLCALAVAGPAWQREPSLFAADAPPVMLVLRVTPSMRASDLAPSRLERAKEKIADLLAADPGQAFGLIAYAGSAHLVLPPTKDAAVVRSMAQALSPEIMPRPGEALAEAVALAHRVLAEGGAAGGSILLLADEAALQEAEALHAERGTSVALLAMLPEGRAPPAGLRAAASALDARVERATADGSDVAALAGRLSRPGSAGTRPGEAERWRDAGWYLVPFVAAVVLLWFRRGWVVLE